MTLLRICSISGVSVLALAGAFICSRRRRETPPEQRETLRRQRISAEGRVTDGTVLDVQGFDSSDADSRQLIHYAYNIGGVHYECAQDVTTLCELLNLRSRGIRIPTSVKYDSQQPGNSIVAAEDWCGLRAASHPSSPEQ